MNSFDVFDTLIARRYIHSDYIWEKMGRDIDIPNFAALRKQANYGNFNNIYDQMVQNNSIPGHLKKQLMELEIQYEQDTIFPIKENMVQVNHGDLLVSDMYLSAPDILRLVRSCGLDKQVTIYASIADKHHGTYWKAMRGHLKVGYHLGDNGQSDIKLAAQQGFKAVHYTKSSIITGIERELQDKGMRDLAMLVREVRLRNFEPAGSDELFSIANQLNLPWLFITCEILRRRHPDKNIVYLGRDCQLMHKIHHAFFDQKSYYLPLSRRVAYNQTDNAVRYLQTHLPEDYMLVDISSTGKTWAKIGQIVNFPITVCHYDTKYGIQVPPTFGWLDKAEDGTKRGTNLLFEVFNCADHGMLDKIEIINGMPIAQFESEPEMGYGFNHLIQKPILAAIELVKHYEGLRAEMTKVSEKDLWYFFDKLPRSICAYQKTLREGVLKPYYDRHDAYANELGPV